MVQKTSKYERYSLGPEAIDYIRKHLQYETTLGDCLQQEQSLDGGTVVTYLPPGISDEAVKDFNRGGKVKTTKPVRHFVQKDGRRITMVPKGDTDDQMAMLLEQSLKASRERVCIFEDVWVKPEYSFFPDVDPRFVRTLDDEVYYVVFGSDQVDSETLLNLVKKANPGWHSLCVVTSLPAGGAYFEQADTITADEIRDLVKRAIAIIVAAYDGEGYLIWSKT